MKEIIEIKNLPRKVAPHNIDPMLGVSSEKPFDNDEWIFEIKWDGYRAIAEVGKKNIRFYSRNHIPFEDKFEVIAEALKKLEFEAVLDGEIVVLDKNGNPDFGLLQDYRGGGFKKKTGGNLIYYVFDILHYQGRDLTSLELVKRKDLLKKILPDNGYVKFSGHVKGEGISFFNAAKNKGLEGIVAKYSKSRYMPGTRSKHWLKIKSYSSQDCVIAGFTEPRRSRKYFGSLVLGVFDKNKLIYIGHSGGGFNGQKIRMIYDKLRSLVQENCPFETIPSGKGQVTWVNPELVCEVAFAGWTKDGVMRQPNFLRFREDKLPADAVLEKTSSGGPK